MSKDVQPSFETEDIKNIRRMSRHKDIFELLARSLGHWLRNMISIFIKI